MAGTTCNHRSVQSEGPALNGHALQAQGAQSKQPAPMGQSSAVLDSQVAMHDTALNRRSAKDNNEAPLL